VSDVLTLPIRTITETTPQTRLMRLDLGSQPFAFRAGQAALIGAHGQTLRRPYSIASSPEDARRHRRIEFLIKVDASGHAGLHLPTLAGGVRVDFEGPSGSFALEDETAPAYLFVAGGTGVAPLRSMTRHLIASGVRVPMAFVYSVRGAREFAFRGELERLAGRGLLKLLLTDTGPEDREWPGARGRIGADQLAAMLPDRRALCFLCGPPAFVEELPDLLRALGVGMSQIRFEEW
jgi:ferredoxin-NADP reductase